MKNKILVVSVHPDDETLGCGGTLLKYKANPNIVDYDNNLTFALQLIRIMIILKQEKRKLSRFQEYTILIV